MFLEAVGAFLFMFAISLFGHSKQIKLLLREPDLPVLQKLKVTLILDGALILALLADAAFDLMGLSKPVVSIALAAGVFASTIVAVVWILRNRK